MKIAVLSDSRLPTSKSYYAHGMGKVNITIAEGLLANGHDVTLYAGVGSEFAGKLLTAADEREFVNMRMDGYDAILDGGHFHTLGKMRPELPVINLSQDREAPPGKNAVFSSEAHRRWHGYSEANGRVIYNGVELPELPAFKPGKPYFAYVSMFHSPKAPIMAAEAARLAGVRVVFAGPTPPMPPPGCEYVGPLWGEDKFRFFAGAAALLFPASTEAGAITPLEAQSVDCPVITVPYGAAHENMCDGVTGFVARDTVEMAEMIAKIDTIDRQMCRQWIADCRSVKQMIDGYEQALTDVAKGVTW